MSMPSLAYGARLPKRYVLGGSINDIPSSTVWIFDSRFSRWEIGPKMCVGREFATVDVLNGKIYVMGGCLVDSWARSTNWAEVAVVDGVLYCYNYLGKIRGYDVKEGIWKELKGVQKDLPKFLCGATNNTSLILFRP
ncbi:F-box/kelch-repeat protein SKIP6-like [Telopea speciosissima]|uniref:F-box/kelch-repeat protein SKIP6-like n=1 Tax=Telopea speciosissima TaxID=54955 RepID=UPI001CC51977|nr:F-box/kelch-repeat protein SKIP6-like [Telopea speciosissima]